MVMTYDEIKVDKLRDFVAFLETDEIAELLPKPGETRKELVRRVKAHISWLEQKIENISIPNSVSSKMGLRRTYNAETRLFDPTLTDHDGNI